MVTGVPGLKQVAHRGLQTSGDVSRACCAHPGGGFSDDPRDRQPSDCVVVKEARKQQHIYVHDLERVAAKVGGTVWTAQRNQRVLIFPLLIRTPQGAKSPLFLDYRLKNKLIKT